MRAPTRLTAILTASVTGVAALTASVTSSAAPSPKPTSPIARPAAETATAPAPTGPAAPAGFAQQLKDIYHQMVLVYAAYPPPSGQTVPVPDEQATDQQIDAASDQEIQAIYDTYPDGWDKIQAALTGAAAAATQLSTAPSASAPTASPQNAPRSGATAQRKVGPKISLQESTDGGSAGLPSLPSVPTPRGCPQYDGVIGLETSAFALKSSANVLEVASKITESVEAFLPRDETYGAIVAGEGTVATLMVNLPEAVLGKYAKLLDAIAATVEFQAENVDFVLEQVNTCNEFDGADTLAYLQESMPVLAKYALASLDNENAITTAISNGFAETGRRLSNLQTSVDTAQASLDLALKERIQTALLAGGTTPNTDFELPSSAGGYLDATPIGVKQIVTDALSAMQKANQPISSSALRYLTLANTYLIAKQYKKAFSYYQLAYQGIAE